MERIRSGVRFTATFLVAVSPVVLVVYGYLKNFTLFRFMLYSLTMYGIFTLVHFLFQYWFALTTRFQRRTMQKDYQPKVTLVVPIYREQPDLLRRCLTSVLMQTYPFIDVIVSNDDSDDATRAIYEEFAQGRRNWRYLQDGHQGKRATMKRAMDITSTELLILIDSDTILGQEAVQWIIQPFQNPRVGCATGNITVLNRGANILTWLTDMRYWLAFNFERAAQSALGVMSCVSGPLGCYRTSLIRQIKDEWLNQTFLGHHCTYGDDRDLTNRILSLGFQSVYVSEAIAETQAPAEFSTWLLQQLRWTRSFYREYLLNWRWFHKHNVWLAYDLTYQAVFPFLLSVNIVILLWLIAFRNPAYFLLWFALILIFGLIRAFFALIFTRRIEFLGFMLYSILYTFFLLPLKWVAIFSLDNTSWGTR